MNLCYIALGSNLENPSQQLQQAVEAIKSLGSIQKVSSFYHSLPMGGPKNQPDYVNAVLSLATELDDIALLDALQRIENQQGRVRHVRFGARTLDLDILLFNQSTINKPRLSVPHPRMLERSFVLTPLYEIAPTLSLPNGELLKAYQQKLDQTGLEKLA